MKKRILSFLLAAVMVLLLIPVIAVPVSATPSSITITGGSFVGYKGWLKAYDGQNRYTQRGGTFSVRDEYPITNAYDGNNTTYANTYGIDNYYPMAYLNGSGELVVDTTYNNVNVDVDINTYLASGLGKYYGIFTFTLTGAAALDTITVYSGMNKDGSVDAKKAFDVLYSADGTHWTLAGSYTGMGTASNWTSSTSSLATLNVPGNDDEASYVAVAFSSKDGQMKGNLWLFEVAVTGMLLNTVYSVSTAAELIDAVKAHNVSKNTADMIKLTADIVLPDSYTSDVGTRFIYGIFDGQGHTVYNLQSSFVWPYGNCLIKDFTVSNKTASGGSTFYITGKDNAVFGGNAVASEIAAGETSIIRNVTNERDLIGTDNYNGGFFGALTIAGTVKFEYCIANNRCLQRCDSPSSGGYGNNHKIGNYVGCMNSGTVVFENCVNNGEVNGSQVGGFIGIYSAGTTVTLTNCTNTGNITGIANGTAFGVAGGLIGGFNNATDVTSATTITITGCTNTGDVKVKYTADSSKDTAAGGFIGHAGGVDSGSAVVYNITINNCGVYDCTIDAVGDDDTYGQTSSSKEYAGSFLGKVSPQGDAHSIVAKNSYVSNVNVRADHARRFLGVGSYNKDLQPMAVNLVAVNLNKLNVSTGAVEEWDGARHSNCATFYSADTETYSFTQTDDDAISGGGAGSVQYASDKARFASTFDGDHKDDYKLIGYQIVASYNGGSSVKGWTKTSKFVFSSIYETLSTGANAVTANDLHAGDDWIFALTVENIPTNVGEVTFYVTPFIVKDDDSIIFGYTGTATHTFGS